MIVRVRIFGPEAVALGTSSVDVTLGDSATCGKLLEEINRLHPGLTGRIAVNHAFAAADLPIREGDEVALIGLVSGG